MIERIADITLERYRLRELPAAEYAKVEALCASSSTMQRRLAALEHSDVEIAALYPARVLADAVVSRVQFPRGASRRWMVGAIAAAAVAIVAAWPSLRSESTERVKGAPAGLTIYRNTAGGSETLTDNALVHAGDVIRVGYRIDRPVFGAILSIDGRDTVSRHLPIDGDRAIKLQSSGLMLVDGSFQLDDAPAHERFFFVTSPSPFDVAPVELALRISGGDAARLSLPSPLHVVTFSLRKDIRQ